MDLLAMMLVGGGVGSVMAGWCMLWQCFPCCTCGTCPLPQADRWSVGDGLGQCPWFGAFLRVALGRD
eukprot:6451079-Amphidinium_carterae.1